MVKSMRKLKKANRVSEEEIKVRNLIILLIIVVLVCVGLYFLTDTMLKNESKNKKQEEVTINYDLATIGTMFNRIEKEYYVLLYSNEDNGKDLNSYLDKYRSSDNYIKTYYIDLDNKFNANALGNNLVEKPNNSSEVKVNGATLYKISDGKVLECISGVDNILKILSGE